MRNSMLKRKRRELLLTVNPSAKEKVVCVMGATGTGKSRLAVDIAKHFRGEILNSDKMQVYQGLPILTNKITNEEKRGVPHHLLGIIDDPSADFTAADFCESAARAAEEVAERGRLPIIAGGSNSYIEALMEYMEREYGARFDFCFLWVDVSVPVLHSAVSRRVDRMVELGLVEEARGVFDPEADYSRGIRKSIGVPELDLYFQSEETLDEANRAALLREAVREIKINTCRLVNRQLDKIHRIQDRKGRALHRIDATVVHRKSGAEAEAAWEELVVAPSAAIVRRFLNGDSVGPSVPECFAGDTLWRLPSPATATEESFAVPPYDATKRNGRCRKTGGFAEDGGVIRSPRVASSA